jgi:flavin-dependent dehydrogenase
LTQALTEPYIIGTAAVSYSVFWRGAFLKIAIVGAGITGSYLHRFLAQSGHLVDLFDRHPTTRCGINPCAWGTSADFFALASKAGLDPSAYVLVMSDHVYMDGIRIKAELLTFDKRRFIADLREGVVVNYGEVVLKNYDRVVDASGVSRAMLPPIANDIISPCIQYRIQTERDPGNQITLGSVGYAWCFPLSSGEYHIGSGSVTADPQSIIERNRWTNDGSKVVCRCASKIRLTGPHCSLPFFLHQDACEIWGVGEAIGCVAPLAGDGVVPGMRSVQILLEQWENPQKYEKAILREFRWMKNERAVVDKLRNDVPLTLGDAWVLKKNSRRMGMEVRVKDAGKLMRHLRLSGTPNPATMQRGSLW